MGTIRTTASMLAALIAGCATPTVSTVGSHRVHAPSDAVVRGPFVPAGTIMAVRMVDAIDTLHTPVGSVFHAAVVQPMRTLSGETLVPAGAIVSGRLASSGRDTAPRLRLEFDTVATVHGAAALHVAIRSAQRELYPGPVIYRSVAVGPNYPLSNDFGSLYATGRVTAVGGGPSSSELESIRPREVRLGAGAELQLVLTEPIAPY